MAAAECSFQDLCEEATCAICLDYFTQPVTTHCGHNFCQTCLEAYWEREGATATEASCPQCRGQVQRTTLRPNWQLANLVKIVKKLSNQEGKGEKTKGEICEKHQEPLKLFCKDDRNLICVVCDRSKEHRTHDVVPLEEAAQEFQHQICSHLETLKKERKDILTTKADAEKECEGLLMQTKTEKENIESEFRKLHQLLEAQERFLLGQIEEREKEIVQKRDEYLVRISKELSSLESLIQEVEKKCQQTASELLQDVTETLKAIKRRMTFVNPMLFPPELEGKIWEFWDMNPFLKFLKKQLKDAFLSRPPLQKANVNLDPDTAYPQFIISKDCKSVIWGDKGQHLPDKPQRFDTCAFLLGHEEFITGRHFWDVVVEDVGTWSVGVARKSVKRKGPVGFGVEEGIWAVGKWEGRYWMTNHPNSPRLTLKREPKRIRVCLNYEEGRVAFYNSETRALLLSFSEASFTGEPLLPFFYVTGKGQLRISS